MKQAILPGVLIAIAAQLLSSCDDVTIDTSDRYIYVKPADVSRAVLIEDFTGQQCSNCPTATEMIAALQEQYGADTVIAVAIHSGPLGFKGNSKYVGLATDLGDTYYSYYGASYQPVGMVNRDGLSDYYDWATLVYNALQKKASLDLDISAAYDAESATAAITVEALGTDGTTDGHLQLWAVEDSITAMQMQPDGTIDYSYVHNHVLRAAVNGTWGESFTVDEGETSTTEYTLAIESDWVASHMSIVAFVYNDGGVQQVAKAEIVKSEE